ncbi:hypothetical protein [Fluviicola sp.]|uniref:hypothetical protein n=1 Tax=Fluviicola sp. TaxID=1917219 RepID=UPI0026148F33|nr:hypothetical protein [Fluviicola sp.]
MKTKLLIVLITFCSLSGLSQSILSTTESKSGILVGTDTNYVGIGYESSSDKFTFNCRLTKQNKLKDNQLFPDFVGINFGTSANIEKNKSPFIQEKKWGGKMDFEFTFFKTWDKTIETKSGQTANEISPKTYKFRQNTLYFKLSDAFQHIKTFETTVLNPDTTFVNLYNPLQNNLTFSTGFNWYHNNGSNWYFSYAISGNISYINKSTRSLSTSNLVTYNGTLINSADSIKINQFGDQESYFRGKAKNEIYLVPRADVFVRYSLGPKKTMLGILVSYSPLISSLKDIKVRNCLAIGPTLGLSKFPSQVVFGLMNEFIQNSSGKFKYTLTFNASFPIIFK